MTELTKGLRGQLLNCECYARSQGECGCGATWPEDYCAEAADEIERQRAVIADFEQTPCWREYREENKKLTEERDELVADAKRWRYWRSLFDISTDTGYAAQLIERATSPDELDAAVDAAMKENG